MLAHFETELAFAFSFWKFKDLDNPVSAHWAAEAVARADVILFSLPGHDLTPETMNWLDMCAQPRTKAEGAFALIVAERPTGSGGRAPLVPPAVCRTSVANGFPAAPAAGRGREARNISGTVGGMVERGPGRSRQQSLGIERVSGASSSPAQSGNDLVFPELMTGLASVERLRFSPLSLIRRSMLVVHVQVHVKPECVEAFKQATLANARESLKEPGVARFDVVQQQDDPTRFVLVEAYRDAVPPPPTRKRNIIRSGGTRSRR